MSWFLRRTTVRHVNRAIREVNSEALMTQLLTRAEMIRQNVSLGPIIGFNPFILNLSPHPFPSFDDPRVFCKRCASKKNLYH